MQGEASAGRSTLERSVAGDPGAARTACTSSARALLPLAGNAESTSCAQARSRGAQTPRTSGRALWHCTVPEVCSAQPCTGSLSAGCEESTGTAVRKPGAQDRRSHAVHQPSETPKAAYQPELPQARGREELAGDCSRGEGRRQVPDDESDGSRAPGIHTASLALKHAACQQRGLPGARRRRPAVLCASKPAIGALRRQQPGSQISM